MLEILGAICGTSIWFALICLIIGAKKNKYFIRAGFITWLFCSLLYGLFSKNFLLFFFIGMFIYSFGCALWTGLAVYLDRTGKNVKWVLKYIPLGMIALMIFIPVAFGFLGMISGATQTQKRSATTDEVFQIVTGVRQLLGGYDDFNTINNATIFDAIGMSNKNPYGGTYELAVDPTNSRQFVVSINGLSETDCKALVTKSWTDSVGQRSSNGKSGGASGSCRNPGATNTVRIVYGE